MTTAAPVPVRDPLRSCKEVDAARTLRAYAMEAKYEFVRILRLPGFVLPFLLIPVALYLFFGIVLSGGAKDPKTGLYIFVAFCVLGVMGPGMFGFGVFVATERDQGLLTLKRALPIPAGSYLIAKMCMAVLFAALVMIVMIAAGAIIGHLPLSPARYAALAGVSLLGALPFCAIGLFIGTRASGKSAPAFVNLIYLPMIYLSGFFFPLPESIRWIQFASPAFYVDQLALKAAGMAAWGTVPVHVAVLIGITLLLGIAAIRRLARRG